MIAEHNNATAPNKMLVFQYVTENNVIKINCIISVRFVIFIPNICKCSFLYREYIVQTLGLSNNSLLVKLIFKVQSANLYHINLMILI